MKRILYLAAVALLLAACTQETNPGGTNDVVATAIELNKHELTLKKGANETLTVTFTPSDVADNSLVWVSSNKSVAEVTDGVVVGVDAGSTEIIVKHGDLTDRCAVTVTAVPVGAVDLGLSVYWATCNLCESGFVSTPEEYGDYFAWGELEPHYVAGHSQDHPCNDWREIDGKTMTGYDWVSYKFRISGDSSDNVKFSKYNTSSSYGTVDNKTTLEPEDDVAHVKLGGKWRMPTDDEWTELINQCTWTWTTENGVNGRKVTSPSGNSIFLPATGYWCYDEHFNGGIWGEYWSSSLKTDSPCAAQDLYFYSEKVRIGHTNFRFFGLSVRPVSE